MFTVNYFEVGNFLILITCLYRVTETLMETSKLWFRKEKYIGWIPLYEGVTKMALYIHKFSRYDMFKVFFFVL